ncbi:MAG TPA: DUF5668 domain-containing protein [Candidatus Angelobacter sp.]|nr:DUF5668 domain-containing protein [Candidatus Angelobacter sp.]
MSCYTRNNRCSCARCRAHSLTGAAFLITLGVLFLLDQNWIISFDKSWPILLLVIGGMIFFCRTASTENHIEPYRSTVPMNPAPPQPNTWNPPPPPPASSVQPNPEVKS